MRKNISKKGFAPVIFLIIGAVAIASATFGIVKYKNEITANISKAFKLQNENPNTDENPNIKEEKENPVKESENAEQPIIDKKTSEVNEQKRLEEEAIKAETEKLLKEADEAKRKVAEEEALRKMKEEARVKAEQELQQQLEAQRMAEEQRKEEELRQQVEAQLLAEKQRKQEELTRKQKADQLLSQLIISAQEIDSQLAILDSNIKTKEAEIESIKKDPWLSAASRTSRIAKVVSGLNPLIDQYNSLLDKRERIVIITYKIDDYANYGTILPAEDRAFLASLGITF
jgi:glutamate synthase domain-containing protein 2